MDVDGTPMTLQAIVTALDNIQASRFVSLASYVVLLYDLILTMPKEIALIWTGRWSIVKVLFFILRYTVPIVITINMVQLSSLDSNMSNEFCQRVILILIYWQLIAMAMVDAIVSLRIHALWRRRVDVFVVMAVLFVITYATTLGVTIYITATRFNSITFIGYGINLCGANPPKYIWAIWLPGFLFEAVICSISLVRTWQHYTIDRISLVDAIKQDGIIYFLFALAARLFDVLIWSAVDNTEEFMLLGEHFSFAVTGVIISRLLLNLRGVESQEEWSEATEVLGSITSNTEKMTTLWVADTGGQSFLEQIYGRVYSPELRPRFAYMDEFTATQ